MTVLSFIAIASVSFLLWAAPLQGLGHVLAAVWRKSVRKRPANWNRQILLRAGLFAVAVAVVFVLYLLRELDDEITAIGAAVIFVVVFVTVPVWYLVSAYRSRTGRFAIGSYFIALLALASMPAVATMTYLGAMAAYGYLSDHESESEKFLEFDAAYFMQENGPRSDCAQWVMTINRTPSSKESDAFFRHVDFWFDQTARGALFDVVEVFDCRISPYTNNPKNMVFSGAVILYRLFAEFILVTVLVWPFAALIGRLGRKEA